MVIFCRFSLLLQLSMIISHHGIDAFGVKYCGSAKTRRSRIPAHERGISALESRPPCFWKGKGQESKWEERIHMEDLFLGQELSGYVVDDLSDGKTGPKLFFECGVGRTSKGKWTIVHAMMRLPRSKPSVAIKRAARLRKKNAVQLFVSRIQEGCGRLEVCATREEAETFFKAEKKRPISSLRVGEEIEGVVVQLKPFGAFVDVGANRVGLLHIRTVAELYNRYIDKEKGLIAAGLEQGAKIRLSVASIEKRRLSLDFTPDVKFASAQSDTMLSGAERNQEGAEYTNISQAPVADEGDEEENYEEEDDDEYDEDREIEDSLGLGFY